MKRTVGIFGILVAVAIAAGCASTPDAADPQPEAEDPQPEAAADAEELTIWDGVFTRDQATRGQRVSQAECFVCHSEGEWTASTFLGVWTGRSIRPLYDNIRLTMPYDAPGRLSRQEYADIVAFILQLNGAEPGDTELPSNEDGLEAITITSGADE